MQMEIKRKLEWQYSLSGTIHFKIKKLLRERRTLHSDQGRNPGRRYNYKCIFTQHRSISIYTANINSHKRKIHNNTIVVEDFNTTLNINGQTRKIKVTQTLKETLDQMNLTDIYRAFHLKAGEYTFKCIWNILYNRSHARPQIRSQYI